MIKQHTKPAPRASVVLDDDGIAIVVTLAAVKHAGRAAKALRDRGVDVVHHGRDGELHLAADCTQLAKVRSLLEAAGFAITEEE